MLYHLDEIAVGSQAPEEEIATLTRSSPQQNGTINALSPGCRFLREGLSPIEAARYEMAEYL
jgi:hypothetical protein